MGPDIFNTRVVRMEEKVELARQSVPTGPFVILSISEALENMALYHGEEVPLSLMSPRSQ
jgi:hypothetical protein